MKTSNSESWVKVAAVAGVLLAAGGAGAQTLSYSIGTQHFTDGQLLGTGTFITAVAGQPAPFDHFDGSDATGPNFDVTWNFDYPTPAGVGAASLTLGIYDHDSAAAGNQVSLFTAGGTDLTSLMNAAFESRGGLNGEYNVYTITLPAATYAALESGGPSFELALQGPGLSVLGPTTYNGAGLDFATITISVPEPAATAGVLALTAVASLWLIRRRR